VFQTRIDRSNVGDWVFHSRRLVALIGTNGELQNIFLSHSIRLEFVLFKNKNSEENVTLQHAYQMCKLCCLVYAALHIFLKTVPFQATLPYIHSVTQTFTSVRSASHVVGNSVKTLREFQPKNYAIVSRDLAEN